MIDISFVQDNLPTSEEQLELFKQLLDTGNKERNTNFIFHYVSELETISRRDVLKLGVFYKPDSYIKLHKGRWYETDIEFLNSIVEKMLVNLAVGIFNFSLQGIHLESDFPIEVYILEPKALLEQAYISFVQTEESFNLIGTVGIYFNN